MSSRGPQMEIEKLGLGSKIVEYKKKGLSYTVIRDRLLRENNVDISEPSISRYLRTRGDSAKSVAAHNKNIAEIQAKEFFNIAKVFYDTNKEALETLVQIKDIITDAREKLLTFEPGAADYQALSSLLNAKTKLMNNLLDQIRLNGQLMGTLSEQSKTYNVNVIDLAPKINVMMERHLNLGNFRCAACGSQKIRFKEIVPLQRV